MSARIGLIAVLAMVAGGLAGCATCHHKASAVSLGPPACLNANSAQRSRVHVIMIAGVDIFDDGGLCQLRDAVNAAGFTQVYYGHSHHYHCGWFGREMRRIAVDDPEARLIFVGYGVGAGNAAQLATEAQLLGYNVDGLVLLDPIKLSDLNKTIANIPILIIGSDRWKITSGCPGCEIVRLPDVCHYSIATDPYTVERTIDLLRNAVACVPENAWPVLVMPLIDDPAPVPAVITDIEATPHVPLSNVP